MIRKNLAGLFTFFTVTALSATAFAEDGVATHLSGGDGLALFAAAFAISIAAFGGALGQGKAGAAALDGISRNPGASGKVFTPMILALALIESLVIYALLIAFQIVGKVA
ncbi:MAG: F-type H+-transporting ATPase subunit c [Bradymonadia bacterium]|jgi:F-type H+-transporting ATPase subunit c